jgi:uncharacterized protein (TIGR03086 family)
MTDPALLLLQCALDQTHALIAGVTPDDLSAPTPCTAWTVGDLMHHVVVVDLSNFAVAARGGKPDWNAAPGALPDDWAAAFAAGSQAVRDAWAGMELDDAAGTPDGAMGSRRSELDMQLAELAVHGWDLARATGQSVNLNHDLAQHALGWSHGMLKPEYRGADQAFGVEIPVPDDAPIYDRLAGQPFPGARPHRRPTSYRCRISP